jgi:hypothetical protein
MHDALNRVLAEEMRAGKRFVLVIDEAQNLKDEVLESVRLLSNFETPWMKLMQIVIAGQPGLAETLSRPSMTQLRQRISFVIRVAPLNKEEVNAYIDHRLHAAGCKDPTLFTLGARSVIAEYSEGIPRKINNVCFNAMSLACALKRKRIERNTVLEVLADLDLESLIENTQAPTVDGKPIRVMSEPRQPTERSKVWFGGWAPKFVVVGALVMAVATGIQVGDVVKANGLGKTGDPEVQHALPLQTPADASPTSLSPEQVQEPVLDPQGQTQYQRSEDKQERNDPQVLAQIRNLNSALRNNSQILGSEQVRIPSAPSALAVTQTPVLQEGKK